MSRLQTRNSLRSIVPRKDHFINISAALIQMTTTLDRSANLAKAEDLVREAAAQGAKIICLQELFNSIYFCFEINKSYMDWAETVPGPTIEKMQGLAREVECVLVAPIYERALAGLLYNTAVIIGPNGEIIGKYRKSSIPLVKEESMTGIEKAYFAPGDTGFCVFDTPFGVRIGILICYDRHFPEAARILALGGADIILVPTATTGLSREPWEIELRSHAIANSVFVGGVNRVGHDQGGLDRAFFGSSLWIAPNGQVMCQAGSSDDEILLATLDLGLIEVERNNWGFFRDRRPDLYADLL